MNLTQLKRRFPFALDSVQRCPECGGVMDEACVRDPATQSHWRGVRASVCEDCDYAERLE